MKTPDEIALAFAEDSNERCRMREAIEADRAQRDRLADGTARFTVEFDKHAWVSATVKAQQEWLNRAVDALNSEVYVTKVEVGYHD